MARRFMLASGLAAAVLTSPLVLAQSAGRLTGRVCRTRRCEHFQALLRMDTSDPPGNERQPPNT